MWLSELLDIAGVQKLAEANFNINGMPLGIVDASDGRVLVAVGWQDICTRFHRVHPESALRCRESDDYIKEHLSPTAPCGYTCKNGMIDVGVPVIVAGQHLATLFLGQFFYEEQPVDRAFFAEQARRFGWDDGAYLAALDRVPRFSRRAVDGIVAYNVALARFLSELAESARRHERDDSALRESEARYRVLTGLYSVLSRVNESIVRARDERALFEEVCRIIAAEGGFPLVWIGLVSNRQVTPAAWSGPAAAYLGELRVELDGRLGQGPTGTCVREQRPVINDDFDSNPATAPWRAQALLHGLRASAAIPLRREGVVVGALTLYASGSGLFTPERIRLLEALGADLSHALDALAHERLRTEAEEALRESERDLREADQRKNAFLGVLSHELRNPLAPIRNSLYVLDRTPPGGEQAAHARAVIGRQVDHLARLVDDLLDVTRISRGKVQLRRERLDLGEVVARTVEDHRRVFAERGIGLGLRCAEGPIVVDGDPTRISQVVSNLLHNGEKFTDHGGEVTVAVERDGTTASIRVADTGIGIAPDMMARLFEPFTQADGSLHRSRGGLGLGLALTKGFVEQHGGSIDVRSEGLGRGAEFTVRLPIAAAGAEERRAAPPRREPVTPRRILIIEDNRDAAETLGEVLQLEGHEVAIAFDGRSGVERVRSLRPDVVFCDVGLPELDGYGVARAVRADPAIAATVLIALTGYALPDDQRHALDAGFDHHLSKPVDLVEFPRLLARLRR